MRPLNLVKLYMQNALLGAIVPSLRAVTVDVNESNRKLFISFYYDGEITDELFDLASVAIAEVDMPGYDLDEQIIRIDFPEKIPFIGHLVYLRKE